MSKRGLHLSSGQPRCVDLRPIMMHARPVVNRKIQSATMHCTFFWLDICATSLKLNVGRSAFIWRAHFFWLCTAVMMLKSAAQCLINKRSWTQLSNHFQDPPTFTANKWIFGLKEVVLLCLFSPTSIANVKISPKLWVADVNFKSCFLGACVVNNQNYVGVHFSHHSHCTLCCQYQFWGTLQIFTPIIG